MGNAISKNTSNQVVNLATQISNENLTNCYVNLGSNQTINITNNSGCSPAGSKNCQYVLKNAQIYQNSALSANQSCTATGSFTSNINSQISQAASQLAQSLNQNLNLNPGSTQASNLANEIANVMSSVVTEIQSTCYAQAITNQTVNISGNNGPIANNLLVSQQAFENEISQCVFNFVSNSRITNTLQQMISQSAKATVEDSLGLVLVAIAVIAIVFFLLTIEVGGYIVLIIVILGFIAALYLLIAYFANLPPFRTSAPAVVVPGTLASNINLPSGSRSVSFSPSSGKNGSYQVIVTFPPLKQASEISITIQCPSNGACPTGPQLYALAIGDVAAVSPAFTFNTNQDITVTLSSESGLSQVTVAVQEMPNGPTGLPLPATLGDNGSINLTANIPVFFNISGDVGSARTFTATSSVTTGGNLNIFIPEVSDPLTLTIPLSSSLSQPFTLPSNSFNTTNPSSWTLIVWSTVNTNLTNTKIA